MNKHPRVGILVDATSGGVGKHVIDLCHGLATRSFSLAIAYGGPRINDYFRDGIQNLLESPLVQAQQFPIAHSLNSGDFSCGRRIRGYFSRHRVDIVHCHSTKAGFIGRLAHLGGRGAIVYTPHAPLTMDHRQPRLRRGMVRVLEAGLALVTDAVIAVSPDERKHLLQHGIAADKAACDSKWNRHCVISGWLPPSF
jgi:hypothetical protein